MSTLYSMHALARILAALTLLGLAGCGPKSPKIHSIAGRIEVQGGNVAELAGSILEVALVSDPTVRGFGEIQANGNFRLQSLQDGELRQGLLEGRYTARILPNDEDSKTHNRATKAIAPRYLKFETSGLAFDVPAKSDVTVSLSAK